MYLNSSEKRRQQLLEQTRNMYSDKRSSPAVHPRYGNTYGYLYGREEEPAGAGTLGIRTFLCVLLFAAFVTMDKQDSKVFHVSSDQIVNEITSDIDIAEVWKNL